MVARPLWERKAAGSNPATPTMEYVRWGCHRLTDIGYAACAAVVMWCSKATGV